MRRIVPFVLVSLLHCCPAQIAPAALGERIEVGNGLAWRRAAVHDPAGRPQYVAVLEADPRVAGVRFELAAATGLDETSDMARRAGATAAINGGFFSKERRALGAFRIAAQDLGVPDPARTAAIVLVGRTPRLQADPTGAFAGARDVMAAGPMLVQGGVIPSPPQWNVARHPRSAIGTTHDGRVLLVSVDGRADEAAGMTFDELAATMQALGCEDALNLDGGGSTTLWLATAPGHGVVNHPCDDKLFDAAGERAVANAVLVFAEPVREPTVPAAEIAVRTALDFSLSRAALLGQLSRRLRAFEPAEFDAWAGQGLFDSRTVDGAIRFHDSAVSNLFFRDAAARARRATGSTWHRPRLDTDTRTFALRLLLTVAADAVPAGEVIRAWLPVPQRDDRQQPLADADADVADAPMRARLLTGIAAAGKPTVFAVACDVERSGVRTPDLDPARALPCASAAFTEERPPHLVFSPALRALAAEITGDEQNPLVVARRCYDWCADHLTYSFAREYSTIACIADEVLTTRRGDCGQSTLLFMTLCRLRGIPARWQSGWVLVQGQVNMHDWCEIRIEPWGWIPVDVNTAIELRHASGIDADETQRIRDFYFGNLDSWRVVFCRDHGRPLVPAKSSPRSDDVDFQRGEAEWGTPARNLYFDVLDFALQAVAREVAEEPTPPAAAPKEPTVTATPYPVLITDRTRADAVALGKLTRPGKVLFTDGFESDASFRSYFEINGQKEGRVAIAREAENVHTGTGSLQLTSTANDGKSCGASPVLWLGDEGHDCVHLRYWIRYAPDYDQGNLNHTGGCLSGVAGTDKWAGMGSAGLRPNGDDHFDSRVEGWRDWQRVPAPGSLICYAYWMDMKRDRDGNFWGNMFGPVETERCVPERGKWLCVEQRIVANTPGKDDGELAVWLDGALYLHCTGFRWRSAEAVKIKRMTLMVYVHSALRDNRVWYDDVVVSTGYVGTGVPAATAK